MPVPHCSVWLSDEHMLSREDKRHISEYWSSTSRHGVVASAHYRATRVGVEILEAGGNAIDAAVATSLAAAVVEPAGSGIGGMAMMMVHLKEPNKTFLLPGPCRAPRRATPEQISRSKRYSGYRAVAVPTYISVMDYALKCYGTMPVQELIAPAIGLALEGFSLTSTQAAMTARYARSLPIKNAGKFFLDDQGNAPPAGTLFRQPILAQTLSRLAQAGLRDFYEGDIAGSIAQDMNAHGGFVSLDDLAEVPDPPEVAPMCTTFRNEIIHAAAPPAGGRTLLQMLNLLDALGDDLDPDTPEGIELLAAIIRRARTDRRRYRFQRAHDPDYASPEYAREAAVKIKRRFAEGETSHICTMDKQGNAVSLTQSIERSFGAKVVTPELGFLYNGYIKAFKIRAKNHPHYLKPGAVARSNAAPTIATKGDRATLAIGSTGSERLISGIFQVLIRLRRQSPFDAVHAPRLHVTPEGAVLIEQDRFAPQCLERLRQRGYTLQALDPFKFGGLQLTTFDGSLFHGVAEPRRDGAAAGIS